MSKKLRYRRFPTNMNLELIGIARDLRIVRMLGMRTKQVSFGHMTNKPAIFAVDSFLKQKRIRAGLALLILATLMLLNVTAAFAERRVALVVGNGEYAAATNLINPRNDAREIADALRRLGFAVHEGLDLDRAGMTDIIRSFSADLENADLALFFYAGHAVQIEGRNHLIPIEAEIETEADLDLLSIDLRLVLRQMERSAVNSIVLLDACRDNPFRNALYRSAGSSRSMGPVTRGLARSNMIGSSLIGYATDPGEIAADGSDGHSPFTRALLRRIETPGVDITRTLRSVRLDVLSETNFRQRPTVTDNLFEDVYLAGQPTPPERNPIEIAALAWDGIAASNDIGTFENFLFDHGETPFGDLALARIDALTPKPKPVLNSPAPEPVRVDPPEPILTGRALVAEVQSELSRLACNTNGSDGLWGPNSSRALASFNQVLNTSFDGANRRLLGTLKGLTGPICAIECAAGFALRNGSCVASPERTTAREPVRSQAAPVCYTFNGKTLCNN